MHCKSWLDTVHPGEKFPSLVYIRPIINIIILCSAVLYDANCKVIAVFTVTLRLGYENKKQKEKQKTKK
jgi:hypothetical protein